MTGLKPRTGKPPMHLIPWAVVPAEWLPFEFLTLLNDGHAIRLPDGDERVSADLGDTLPVQLLDRVLREVSLADVAEVFAHGARKYSRDNWRAFSWDKASEDCYFAAILRHLTARRGGEILDPDSGLPHVAHAACGCMIWAWHIR